ncbi:hypothetical protein NITMOv2_1333 [Nitrospira moscoviensis]|uniref:Uncharacterized protein n=1 Tax=Nitrospira moscoviensis TaxID=42253 RepID=A0A0K2G9W4_NITMO|nr:hypothetical protein NITMOv2_1333 [Nitrospira moscoviensis]
MAASSLPTETRISAPERTCAPSRGAVKLSAWALAAAQKTRPIAGNHRAAEGTSEQSICISRRSIV